MHPVSDDFLAELARSHTVVTTAGAARAGAQVADLAGTIDDGQVTVDASAANRRRCNVTLVDPTGTLTPRDATDALQPYGNEISLGRGVRLAAGDEVAPLGVFLITDTRIDDTPEGLTITVDGVDRSLRVSRARFDDVHTVTAGAPATDVIRDLLDAQVPGLTYDFIDVGYNVGPLTFTTDDDPWAVVAGIARSCGCDLYFDAAGRCVLEPTPDPDTAPVTVTYAEGAQARLLGLTRSLTNVGGYNGVIATGEATGNASPVRAVAWDDDPSSPTYYLGAYGKVPRKYSSPFITTTAQAQTAATSLLRRLVGITEAVDLSGLVNPAHEAGDAIQITRTTAKVDAPFLLDAFTVPLRAAGQMTATTRRRRSAP